MKNITAPIPIGADVTELLLTYVLWKLSFILLLGYFYLFFFIKAFKLCNTRLQLLLYEYTHIFLSLLINFSLIVIIRTSKKKKKTVNLCYTHFPSVY